MNTYHLDGLKMTSRAEAHKEIAEKLAFPDYYGANLDALWDLLTTEVKGNIILSFPATVKANLGDYGENLIRTFEEAAEESNDLTFRLD